MANNKLVQIQGIGLHIHANFDTQKQFCGQCYGR